MRFTSFQFIIDIRTSYQSIDASATVEENGDISYQAIKIKWWLFPRNRGISSNWATWSEYSIMQIS